MIYVIDATIGIELATLHSKAVDYVKTGTKRSSQCNGRETDLA